MASGDAQRTWFPEMIEMLQHTWSASMSENELSARLKVFWYNICPYPTLCRPSPLIGPPRMRFLL